MGWLNFFKKKDSPSELEHNRVQAQPSGTEAKEVSFRVSTLGIDSGRLHQLIDRIVSEDPFYKAYKGLTDEEIKRSNRPLYEYTDVTTMNIVIDNRTLYVEGSEIGSLPDSIYQSIKSFPLNQITAYAYVIGGNYKVNQAEQLQVLTEPVDLEIYLQMTPE